MAKTIPQLTDATTVNAADELIISQGGITKRATGAELAKGLNTINGTVNVKDFGAVGDGVADDTAAFVAAIAAARVVYVPNGTYRLTSTLTFTQFGQSLIGIGGKYNSALQIDHTSGPAITIAQGQCVLQNIRIQASNARQAYTTGTTYELANDLFGVKVYSASGYTTQCLFDRVFVERQPNHGFYVGGESVGTIFTQCESYYNRGHGYAFDDRTIGGGAAQRCGIVGMNYCRALDNGGNAINLSQDGSTCYRFIINNLETIWNAWNTSIPNLRNAEVFLGGQNHKVQQSAFGDLNPDTRTTMNNGDARLVKSTISAGIWIRGLADNIILENNRYISLNRGVNCEPSASAIKVKGAYFTQQQVGGTTSDVSVGFDISTGSTNFEIDVLPSSDVTTMVRSRSYAGTYVLGNDQYMIQPSSPTDGFGNQHFLLNGVSSFTIISGTARIMAATVLLTGEGNTTDSVSIFVPAAAGNNWTDGTKFTVVNKNAYNITINDGAGNIQTASGSNIVLAQDQAASFVVENNVCYEA